MVWVAHFQSIAANKGKIERLPGEGKPVFVAAVIASAQRPEPAKPTTATLHAQSSATFYIRKSQYRSDEHGIFTACSWSTCKACAMPAHGPREAVNDAIAATLGS